MSGTIGFSYDSLDRLTQETSSRFSGYTENNVFDAFGNPTTFRGTSGQTFNSDNQRTGTGYEHDANGNPTTHRGNDANYDSNDRLTSYGSLFEAGYRADGLRAFKHWDDTEAEDPPEDWTYYLYDGGNAICELNEDGDLIATNVFAPDGLVAKRLADGTTANYLFDLRGNTAEIVVGSTVHTNAAYNAWGQCNYTNPVPMVYDPFMHHTYNARWGYLTDETGLNYCQNRYYDPLTGRFMTRDPIGYAGGSNLYGYCGGNPVMSADPSGTVKTYTLYKLIDEKTGELMKWGVTRRELSKRYPKSWLQKHGLEPIMVKQGSRSEILGLERALVKLRPGSPHFQREWWAGLASSFREGAVVARNMTLLTETLKSVFKDPLTLGLVAGELCSQRLNPVIQHIQEQRADSFDAISDEEPPIFGPGVREKYPRWNPETGSSVP